MPTISKNSIKELIMKTTGAKITDDAAEEIAKLLTKKAIEISKAAVKRSKKEGRNKITKQDIVDCIFNKKYVKV